jgi:DnaJ-class molecular chaperone
MALTGAHRALTCDQCHTGHRYQGTSAECAGCHQPDYDRTAQPDHGQVGFSTQCADCHSTTSWTAPYDHSRTSFPLTGAHKSIDCAQCHGDGVYAGKPTTCVSCHQGDYDGTTNPGHAALHFSTTCTDCHTTVTWQGARFDHDGRFFPIYSGAHRSAWSTCADCHNNASTYAVFTCLSCHEHSQGRMDDTHRGRNGYSYDSNACLRCHPVGRADD